MPDHGLIREQVGTIVESRAPGVLEVEFRHDQDKKYALGALPAE